jgi:hypothetical protein
MPTDPPPQSAESAARNLDEAIRLLLAVEDDYAGELITDWLVVYAAVLPDSDDRMVYGLAFPSGHLQNHRALGLLDVARRRIEEDSA